MLIVFDYMIADLEADKTLKAIVTEFFTTGRKLNISIVLTSLLFNCSCSYVTTVRLT